MHRTPLVLTIALGAVGVALPAHAQSPARPIELGIDAGAAFGLDDPTTTVIGIPVQRLRVGFFVSDRVSVEPAIALNYVKSDGSDGFTTFQGDLGVLFHTAAVRPQPQFYLRPFAGLSTVSGGDDSITQFRLGGGVGVKTRMTDRLRGRFEASFAHGFESGETDGGNAVALNVGLSFLTR